MAKISVLSDQVANQIAAGEVIERPASIVKELVENSLDAGSTAIEIEFKKGGTSFIRIEDNGCGMSEEDASLSLQRHATSKIKDANDLNELTSMGFRGEALPSIASVSRFQLQTRETESESGTDILINGGKVVHHRECGMPPGTRMTISQLFNTVPARRKFLKTVATESAHIVHYARLYALAHPEVSFTLIDDGRTLFRTPACARLRDRVMEIYGKSVAGKLIEVDAKEKRMRLSGLIGAPGHSRSSRHEMLIFVNNRPVENRTLGYALIESYYGHIPKGRYPVAFLFLDLSPKDVDVNVHPAKREIRFRNESSVRGFAVRAILEALQKSVEIVATPIMRNAPIEKSARLGIEIDSENVVRSKRNPILASARVESSVEKEVETPAKPKAMVEPVSTEISEIVPEIREKSNGEIVEVVDRDWRFIGWAQDDYALYDTDSGLVVLDYKAARRRVWYARLLASYKDRTVESQKLLLPIPVEFDPVSSAMLTDNAELLEAYGLEVAPFGRNFFRIEAVPSWLLENEAEAYLGDWVDLLRNGSISDKKTGATQELLAKHAVNKIVRGASTPSAAELGELLDRLFETNNPLADPNGRPTFIEIAKSELNRRFHKG
jgi:DNA mismatch repair protein MutL